MLKPVYDCTGSLMERTKLLLKNDHRPLLVIYKETDIPFYWLKKFHAGDILNPSVNRVQYLYEFLTQKALQL